MHKDNDSEQPIGKRIIRTISLYPEHIAAVEAFAAHDRRTFANAIRIIIEDWLAQHPQYRERSEAA